MKCATAWMTVLVFALSANFVLAQDWPQWRGQNRDGKATGFTAPASWPEELAQSWQVNVGDGVATPALVGDRMYVFARQGDDEVTLCLDANTGEEIWRDAYEVQGADGPARGFAGPRSSPVVANGKVCNFGVRGTVSCLDADTGAVIWRIDEDGEFPRFYTSSSPMIVGDLLICQLGGEEAGSIVAYDLNNGEVKWNWAGDGTSYASPMVLELDGQNVIIAETAEKIVALNAATGEAGWEMDYVPEGRGGYNAVTPIYNGQLLIFSGSNRGTKALKLEKDGAGISATEVWANEDNSVVYNSPILKDGLVFGLTSRDSLFCIDAESGETMWTQEFRGRRGYGSIVDAGDVLFAITPNSELLVYNPKSEFEEIARYQVSEGRTYAYPVIAGKRIYIKDDENLTMFTIEE